MSEIQRYVLQPTAAGSLPWMIRTSDGAWCRYTDLAWYRRQYRIAIVTAVLVAAVCGLLAALLVHENASRGPVQVPIGEAERADMLKEREAHAKQIKDLTAIKANYEAQIRHLDAAISNKQAQIDIVSPKINSALAIGEQVIQLNKEQSQRMSTHQGVVLEAKRVLGVANVQIVER